MKVDIFNTSKKYDIIYADPPWKYNDMLVGKGMHGTIPYETMTDREIQSLHISDIAANDCVLFMWATMPKLQEALNTIKAWGFKFKSIAFQWIKLNKSADINSMRKAINESNSIDEVMKQCCLFGLGRWTRGNSEPCLIAVKGKPSRISPSVGQLAFEPLTRHSAKPAIIRDKITTLIGDKPRIELFARQYADGWDCWGNEV